MFYRKLKLFNAIYHGDMGWLLNVLNGATWNNLQSERCRILYSCPDIPYDVTPRQDGRYPFKDTSQFTKTIILFLKKNLNEI